MSSNPSYYARRYRTLFSPDALDFAARQPRPAAVAAIYSPAPTGIHCGLPKAARTTRNPRLLIPFLLPIVLATGIVTYLESRTRHNEGYITAEQARKDQLLDAYGDRESLERLEQVMAMYETTQ